MLHVNDMQILQRVLNIKNFSQKKDYMMFSNLHTEIY